MVLIIGNRSIGFFTIDFGNIEKVKIIVVV